MAEVKKTDAENTDRATWVQPQLVELCDNVETIQADPPGVGFDGGVAPNDYIS